MTHQSLSLSPYSVSTYVDSLLFVVVVLCRAGLRCLSVCLSVRLAVCLSWVGVYGASIGSSLDYLLFESMYIGAGGVRRL